MEKNLAISMLYDFYKELLTEKQAEAIELYYNQDLSLSEIAEHLQITRQGVRDSIKRGEKLLEDLESKLGIVQRFMNMQHIVNSVYTCIEEIEQINDKKLYSTELKGKIDRIKGIIQQIAE